jgi:Fic family protein
MNKAGKIEIAHKGKPFQYEYFMPNTLPNEISFSDNRIPRLLENANRYLGELNAFSKFLPNIDFFIRMHKIKEANLSSAIEGTQTTLDEAVIEKVEVKAEKRDDWQEVNNYVDAMNFAINELKTLPLGIRLLKFTHAELLKGVRGRNKQPGEIRTSQNWIGGSSISDAHFVPPIAKKVPELMSDIEQFIHNKGINIPQLIKVAMLHYQFETIHPFLDGNGRLGRLLITLYLIDKQILDKPLLYLSEYFSEHKNVYYDLLDEVREKGSIEHWVRFFLVAIAETSKKSSQTLMRIMNIKEMTEKKIDTLGKRVKLGKKLLGVLFEYPVFNTNQIKDKLLVTHQTARALIQKFLELKIIAKIDNKSIRKTHYCFYSYLDLFLRSEK